MTHRMFRSEMPNKASLYSAAIEAKKKATIDARITERILLEELLNAGDDIDAMHSLQGEKNSLAAAKTAIAKYEDEIRLLSECISEFKPVASVYGAVWKSMKAFEPLQSVYIPSMDKFATDILAWMKTRRLEDVDASSHLFKELVRDKLGRGVPAKLKLVFFFAVGSEILLHYRKIDPEDWDMMAVNSSKSIDRSSQPINIAPEFLSEEQWNLKLINIPFLS